MNKGSTSLRPTSSHDEEIEKFYEDVELAMRKMQTQYTVVMGDFNAKVVKKQAREQAIGNYGINSRNTRGEMVVEFAERNRLRIMYTFFRKRSNRKWTWKSPNRETRNGIDFIRRSQRTAGYRRVRYGEAL